jgi:phosphate transport system permease protein
MAETIDSATHRLIITQIYEKNSGVPLDLSYRPRIGENLVRGFLFLCAFLSILTTVGFTLVLGTEASKFFATTEWLSANKATGQLISAEDTVIPVDSGGSIIDVGDLLRIGSNDSEIVRVVSVGQGTVEVERGVEGTTAAEHSSSTPIFIAAKVTLVEFLTRTEWAPQIGRFGILPLLNSTLLTSGIAMLVAVPLGLGAAIYLSEYASRRLRNILKPILEILAGIPTVVYGYFALTFMTPLLRSVFGIQVQVYNMLSAGIVVGILIIPTIASISEDAINAVPRSLREASYGLGATKLETIFKILLPAALSGISAAIILGISRAVGETMIVLLAAGAGPRFTFNTFESAETMAGHIARISTGDISYGSIDYNSIFAVGLTLFIMTLILNMISATITRRFREIY